VAVDGAHRLTLDVLPAADAGVTTDDVEPLIDALARLHLVTVTADCRVVCHDLLLEYAAQLTAAHDGPAERDAAVDHAARSAVRPGAPFSG
jgi:hypothetical protein